ncbi:tRNA (adenine(22)-N(1))-methyltransferase [Heyndrickxia oleronia]|jgi:tRNA (adenine22-N1)-methyltransferase|uniref:SAM-dependent methyltransferase n=1 Tax=Heyndrickxia oleronia TaxID=38875 RepID=A0A8E2I8Z8_9BACI|nr:tRNA (adenine(22)-N(1))-methyltransferase TrmK [Heyndrickxia oleronia]NYV64564.1 tRNA (adenine-N(1))-methyltransferase [Bacillus sp. Gen3]OJH18868.1 SAM-dependent methyltransferase [Bacillus obstructivus]MBU5213442.1 tRNA (adenine(22)-N(1))-methyltransferase TrmK [Heyndrickxia oleronia]MCI1593468.1 tRNA (adenine(22)-N(1))-methyltransferase TrmK [Heyndrickxia oleronia]MCI1614763.1 tRNA (adenine(22)-N(1))-methyltransferase TrmK [Heyndrickxia oleronia]
MNSEKLSKRLEMVSQYLLKNSTFADIGSDHAYLPCYAIKKGLAKYAIAGEVVEGPYQTAKQQVMECGYESSISVRKGDGLEVLQPNEVDCITIAGMGGPLIASILENGKDRLLGVKRLILQPNIGANHIRNWCVQNNWVIIAEEILEEDEKIYEIIVAENNERAEVTHLTDAELLLGPFLMQEKSDVFIKKWSDELKQWRIILDRMNLAENQEKIIERKLAIEKNISLVEEVLT